MAVSHHPFALPVQFDTLQVVLTPSDIMTTFCIGHTDTVQSIWYVVDAINKHPNFEISYPSSHEEQRAIA
jgi:hypothetical protein